MSNPRIKPQPLFHERQIGNYCRYHAVNNLFGKSICSLVTFNKYCNEYDKLNKMDRISKTKCVYYNNGDTDNIFGYIIQKAGYNIKMTHYDFYKPTKITLVSNTIGMILYNKSHTYCIRKYNNRFYLIDSIKLQIQEISDPIQYCEKANLGIIVVDPICT
jgi:hypothetical protein